MVGSPPADVLVELLLKLDEAVVALLSEGDVPEHRRHGVRTHRRRLEPTDHMLYSRSHVVQQITCCTADHM